MLAAWEPLLTIRSVLLSWQKTGCCDSLCVCLTLTIVGDSVDVSARTSVQGKTRPACVVKIKRELRVIKNCTAKWFKKNKKFWLQWKWLWVKDELTVVFTVGRAGWVVVIILADTLLLCYNFAFRIILCLYCRRRICIPTSEQLLDNEQEFPQVQNLSCTCLFLCMECISWVY